MKKNAFTLIELLAVIVILAIIALIAVPVVLGIINDSKKSSDERTIELYLDTVMKTIANENLKRKYSSNICEIQQDGNLKCYGNIDSYNKDEILEINMTGIKPKEGTIIFEDGKIIIAENLVLNDKIFDYDESRNKKIIELPPPGLYDENYKLIATWDELVNTYNINIENNHYYPFNNSNNPSIIIKNNNKLSKGKILIISNDVETIGDGALFNCDSLTRVVIPKGVISIGSNSFEECNNLTRITIPSSVTSIGDSAFRNSENLTRVIIPNGVSNLKGGMFSNCSNLKSVIILGNITDIGSYAFYGCTGLTSITIPNSVTSIRQDAFSSSGLENITIPANTTTITGNVFSGCSNLKSIKVAKENTKFEDKNSNAIIDKDTNTLMSGCVNTIIPTGVRIIGNAAFSGSSLSNIVIPLGVEVIEMNAFNGSKNLKSVIISSSVTAINPPAFLGCNNLENVTFENTTGWYLTNYYNTQHVDIDVTNSSTNAANLVTNYNSRYWKRS